MSENERVCARIREYRRSIGKYEHVSYKYEDVSYKYEHVSYLRVALAQAVALTVGMAKLERLLLWVQVHVLVRVYLLEVVLIRHSLIT